MRRTLLTLLATAVLVSVAAAQADKNALVERLRKLKIERYFKSVQENPDLDAKVKQRILRMREDATLGGEQDVIHQALILAYKDYKRGVALFTAEREKDALGTFRELMDSEDKYLKAYAGYRYGLCYLHLERFEDAAAAFTSVLNEYGRRVGCDIDAAFYLAVALGQDLQKEKALVAAQRTEGDMLARSDRSLGTDSLASVLYAPIRSAACLQTTASVSSRRSKSSSPNSACPALP